MSRSMIRPESVPRTPPPRRRTVSAYFEQALHRNRQLPLPVEGELRFRSSQLMARFSVQLDGDRIRAVAFKASTCITLLAYCELLAEWATGRALADANGIAPTDLVVALPGVHPLKHGHAALAVIALQAALEKGLTSMHTKGPSA